MIFFTYGPTSKAQYNFGIYTHFLLYLLIISSLCTLYSGNQKETAPFLPLTAPIFKGLRKSRKFNSERGTRLQQLQQSRLNTENEEARQTALANIKRDQERKRLRDESHEHASNHPSLEGPNYEKQKKSRHSSKSPSGNTRAQTQSTRCPKIGWDIPPQHGHRIRSKDVVDSKAPSIPKSPKEKLATSFQQLSEVGRKAADDHFRSKDVVDSKAPSIPKSPKGKLVGRKEADDHFWSINEPELPLIKNGREAIARLLDKYANDLSKDFQTLTVDLRNYEFKEKQMTKELNVYETQQKLVAQEIKDKAREIKRLEKDQKDKDDEITAHLAKINKLEEENKKLKQLEGENIKLKSNEEKLRTDLSVANTIVVDLEKACNLLKEEKLHVDNQLKEQKKLIEASDSLIDDIYFNFDTFGNLSWLGDQLPSVEAMIVERKAKIAANPASQAMSPFSIPESLIHEPEFKLAEGLKIAPPDQSNKISFDLNLPIVPIASNADPSKTAGSFKVKDSRTLAATSSIPRDSTSQSIPQSFTISLALGPTLGENTERISSLTKDPPGETDSKSDKTPIIEMLKNPKSSKRM